MASKKGKTPVVSAESEVPIALHNERGVGKFYYPNGATYDGEWLMRTPASQLPQSQDSTKTGGERCRDGKGTFIDGDYIYQGDWKEDLMHGNGIFKYASGASYEGAWVMGKYHGNGTYKWANGRMYSGEWMENKMHGSGIFIDKDGHQWSGKFFNGFGPGLDCEI